MEWIVVFDPDFRVWFYEQELGFQDEAFAAIKILEEFGPVLGRPKVDTLQGSSIRYSFVAQFMTMNRFQT